MLDNKLKITPSFVEADSATNQNMGAILRGESNRVVAIAKHGTANLSLFIF